MSNRRDSQDISRREALARGAAGAAGVLLAGVPAAGTAAAGPLQGKAKSVIQIWAAGGPPHLDTFDPKPEAGNDYCGPLNKPIPTNVDGIRIGQLLPMMAQQADKYSIIRSMTHGNNGHETASYLTQTGRRPGDRLVYPCAGAVVSLFKGYDAGYKGLLPPYVVLTQTQGRFSEAGFLGPRYQPFATGGDPAQQRFMVEGVSSQGVSDQQQQNRRDLLRQLDTLGATAKGHPALSAFYESEEQAYDMILGDGAKVFDLSEEKPELRSRYGHPPWSETALLRFGQCCLVARRLVERGVPYITINEGGWDTHTENFRIMQQKLPELDQGFATLLQDLADRDLLATTIVWWGGEFGRTPRVQWEPPWNGGRGHFGPCFSTVVAGGGFKGGHVVGASDETGETVATRPVHPVDLIGTFYELLGIDPDGPLPNARGLDVPVLAPADEGMASGGRLREIMNI